MLTEDITEMRIWAYVIFIYSDNIDCDSDTDWILFEDLSAE